MKIEQNDRTIVSIYKTHLKILLCISQRINTNKLISKELKKSKSTISGAIKKLKRLYLIKETKLFNVRQYDLTQTGKDTCSVFLNQVSQIETKQLPLRSHKLQWTSKIIKCPRKLKEKLLQHNFIMSPMTNWEKYRKQEDWGKVIFNPNIVQYYPKQIFTSTIEEYRAKSIEIIEKIRIGLQEEFKGLLLGKPEETAVLENQHIARLYDPLALEFNRTSLKLGHRIHYHGKNIDIDISKGEPETEFKDRVFASEHLIDIADFFDQWVERPISVKELHKISELTPTIAKRQREIGSLTRKGLKGISIQNEQNFARMLKIQEKTNEIIQKQTGTMNTFVIGMDQHMVMINEIKKMAIKIGQSIDEMKELRKPFFKRLFRKK